MQSAWKREGERQERVSGSETGSSRGKRVPPRLAEREARHRAPGGVRRRGPRRPSRKTPRARASRQTAGGADKESHRAPPQTASCCWENSQIQSK